MALFTASLNSGSNGNCYYIGNESDGILIDAGISCREIEKRLLRLGISVKTIRALFISHEHTDHIRGVDTLTFRHKIPVYATAATAARCRFRNRHLNIQYFSAEEPVRIANLNVTAFKKIHDASDPHSFIVDCEGLAISVITDIGRACENVKNAFARSNVSYLEANYDLKMLKEGKYPFYLKQRIMGGQGHLSNDEALNLFQEYRGQQLSHLVLSHLSRENNCPVLVKEKFSASARDTEVIVASRFSESPMICVGRKKVNQQMVLELEATT